MLTEHTSTFYETANIRTYTQSTQQTLQSHQSNYAETTGVLCGPCWPWWTNSHYPAHT